MERESFENEAIANFVNENFIAIKVDREQRPDVDAFFMTAVVLVSGSGGWPMSSFLTPEGKPFFGGTYYPPQQFAGLLQRVTDVWRTNSEQMIAQADQITDVVVQQTQTRGEASEIGEREVQRAVGQLIEIQDQEHGGFGGAPKFPQESVLSLLLEHAQRTSDTGALNAAHNTLQNMAMGGIHDHVAGGFHRYSTDAVWLVPHFEKMLYNQANLARNYLQAFLLTGDAEHAHTTRRTLDYVLREMTSPDGGFYSATDADSEGEEGTFFIWTGDDLDRVLGTDDAKRARTIWNVTDAGNFEGRNILHLPEPLTDIAAKHGITANALQQQLDQWHDKLLADRNTRETPILDDKIIGAWNGMMITALAEAGDALGEPRYTNAAKRAAEFILRANQRDEQRLWRTYFEGRASIEATLTDYAFMAEAALALFDSTGEQRWLDRAGKLAVAMNKLFWDTDNGGYFMGAKIVGGAELPGRPKGILDGALPSGNAVAMRVLARLWHRTGDAAYQDRAQELLIALSSQIAQQPMAFASLLVGASELLWGESGPRRYVARGAVMVNATHTVGNRVSIAISMAPGWHINAHQPLQDDLIGTELIGASNQSLDGVIYPTATNRKLGFQRAELALYEGKVEITANLPKRSPDSDGSTIPLTLKLQACNDEICLAPETLSLNVSLATES